MWKRGKNKKKKKTTKKHPTDYLSGAKEQFVLSVSVFFLTHRHRTRTSSRSLARIDQDRPGMSTPHLICGPFIH